MCTTLWNAFSSECHHPRASLPVWGLLGAAVSPGGPVYPRAHGARHEARCLQEAQQRSTESLSQPPGQRGWGQGAAAGGQRCITSAKGGQTSSLYPWTPAHMDRETHFTTWTRSHLGQTSDLTAMKRCLCLCLCVHSTKVSSRSSAALLFEAACCEDSLSRPCVKSVLYCFFFGLQWKSVCEWLSWTLILSFYKAVTAEHTDHLPPGVTQNWFGFRARERERGICRSQMLLDPCVILLL